MGIDLHVKSWHITVVREGVEHFTGNIPGTWPALRTLLDRYAGNEINVAYEAGYFGFWLHDELVAYGVTECVVTPPNQMLRESGNRVKTDGLDSRKLAHLLSKGMLKRVWVPDREALGHRTVVRRRRQLLRDRVRVQNRIRGDLRFYGVVIEEGPQTWCKQFVENLRKLPLWDQWIGESFQRLLREYEYLNDEVKKQTKLLEGLAKLDRYRERVAILQSIPGIGLLAAMEILLELQDMNRFPHGKQLAAYVGLTPAQYSSGPHVRMGRISGGGKNSVRCVLVEAAWRLIGKDQQMRERYEQIKQRAGGKRAIVAIARMLLLRTRRMLLDNQPYHAGECIA